MAFEELKQRQAVVWGSGPFEQIETTIADMHRALVERLSPRPGERLLDLGCGTGGVAFLSSQAGADVTGLDLAPALIETARQRAAAQGLSLELHVGDCEALPFEDASFDVVTSSVGVMFAPDHEAVAGEIERVTRRGGRVGLTAWRPEGGVGDMFRVMQPFMSPPPPGVGDPFDWGREEHVEELLGDAFELTFEEDDSPYRPETGEEAWIVFSTAYGPTKALAASLEPERREELERSWIEYFEGLREEDGILQSRTYLRVLGRRR